MPEILTLTLNHHRYDIVIGDRLLGKAAQWVAPVLSGKNVIIISDEHVAKFYLHRLSNALEEANIAYRSIVIKAGENSKSLGAFSNLMEQLLEQKPDRKTTLIALGGGVVGDITGFAASVLLRGVNFIQIPTTLLAQVDSSVGGKTGINSQFGKNLIGAFHQPVLVLSDVSTLATLPKRELLSGYAEIVKYALINDPAFFDWLDANAQAMLAGDALLLAHAVLQCCKAKAAIVEADEKEQNVRALLNLGHTFGHALEAECGYSDELLHGEAVAIGMMLAFEFSHAQGLCGQDAVEKLRAHYAKIALPQSPKAIRPRWNIAALMEHFTRDKKAKDGALTFILTRGIGQAFVADGVEPSHIKTFLETRL